MTLQEFVQTYGSSDPNSPNQFAGAPAGYAEAYTEYRSFLRNATVTLAPGEISLPDYSKLSPLARSLFADNINANITAENKVLPGIIEDFNATAREAAAGQAYADYNTGRSGGGIGTFVQNVLSPIQDIINKVIPEPIRNNPLTDAFTHPINRGGDALQKVFDDPGKLNIGDLFSLNPFSPSTMIVSDVEHPQDAVVQAAAASVIAAGPYALGLAKGIPAGLATLGASVVSLLNKGKDTITTLIDQAKAALSGGKPLDLGSLSNFKIPDLSKLTNLGGVSIPSNIKDALSKIVPPTPAPAQFQSAPDSIATEIPSAGPSPILLAGGALAIIGVIWLMKRR